MLELLENLYLSATTFKGKSGIIIKKNVSYELSRNELGKFARLRARGFTAEGGIRTLGLSRGRGRIGE